MAKTDNRHRRRWSTALSIAVETVGILVQLLLVVVGTRYILIDDSDTSSHARLIGWSLLATFYLLTTALWLNIDLKLRDSDERVVQLASRSYLFRLFSTIVTFSSSIVGLTAAATLILARGDENRLTIYDAIAVWAMLASWAMFHWGYARIYHSHYFRREDDHPLVFPGTERPRLIDFVYFSYTLGTSFAPPDVTIQTSRMRWTVVWHSAFSFFFNALIIVLSMNTIAGAVFDPALFDE